MMTASRLQPRIRLRLRLRLRLAALAIAGTMFLASCTGGGPSIGGSDPAPTNRKLEHIDLATINLPSGLGGAGFLRLGPGHRRLRPHHATTIRAGPRPSQAGGAIRRLR